MNKKLSEKENSDEITTMLVQAGLNVGSNIEHEISEDFIAEQFLMDEISENDLMGFYENGLITLKTIRFLYSDPDLISKFEEGKGGNGRKTASLDRAKSKGACDGRKLEINRRKGAHFC